MRTVLVCLGTAAALLGIPSSAAAQVSIGAGIGIDIRFPEPPPLVVVTPGVRIVPEYDEEVYYVNDYYWVRRADAWYRTRRYDGGWRPVRTVYVPPALVRIPPGRYRHYYRDDDGYWRPHDPDAYRNWRERNSWDERRAWWRAHHRDREIRMEQERSWREHRRHEMEEQRDRRPDPGDRRDRGPGGDERHDRGHGERHGGGHGRH